jgi:hypothetical protein
MVRLIVCVTDAGAAANVGGPVSVEYKTFDIDNDFLQKLVTPAHTYQTRFICGAEVIPSIPESSK